MSMSAKSWILWQREKRVGVVRLTLSSVHWAESMTATTNSKGVLKSKLQVASGYLSFNCLIKVMASCFFIVSSPICILQDKRKFVNVPTGSGFKWGCNCKLKVYSIFYAVTIRGDQQAYSLLKIYRLCDAGSYK